MKPTNRFTIRAIAIFDGTKGLLALIFTTLFITIYQSDAYGVAEILIKDFHVDPQSYYPHLLLMVATTFTGGRLVALCICAYLYSAIKLSEAYGLWRQRQWGRTVGILSIGVLVPFEIYEIFHHLSIGKIVILLINIAIVVILFIGFGKPDQKLGTK